MNRRWLEVIGVAGMEVSSEEERLPLEPPTTHDHRDTNDEPLPMDDAIKLEATEKRQGLKRGRKRINFFKSAKEEILVLRRQAKELETRIHVLRQSRGEESRHFGKWKQLAYHQAEERRFGELENDKLRRAVLEQYTLLSGMMKALRQPMPRCTELGSIEDNEWRMNVLGVHPDQWQHNAKRIMQRMYESLPGWAIRSDLVDVARDTRHQKWANRGHLDKRQDIEVVVCRRFLGHFADLARTVWESFLSDETQDLLREGSRFGRLQDATELYRLDPSNAEHASDASDSSEQDVELGHSNDEATMYSPPSPQDAQPAAQVSPSNTRHRPPGAKRGRKRINFFKSAKEEILVLRRQAKELETRIHVLRQSRGEESRHFGKWKQLAYHQAEERRFGELENDKLRRAVLEQYTLLSGMMKALRQPMPRCTELGSIEDNEWRMNVLGVHPDQWQHNAKRIMQRMYESLPGWAIRSDLVDVARDTRHQKWANRGHLDKRQDIEVVVCRRFLGHFADLARVVWENFLGDETIATAHASVDVRTCEHFGADIRLNASDMRNPKTGAVTRANLQLNQRVVSKDRVTIMWKSVNESLPTTTRMVESSDGWISFEPFWDNELGLECCIMRLCSGVTIPAMDESLVERLCQMFDGMQVHPLEIPCSPCKSSRLSRASSALEVNVGFITDAIWHHAHHVERLAARASERAVRQVAL
ncbi:hypothetical protein P43SY_009788 [Pythium insidiosum]|uniref:M96 mating-specific protein family n=1 Tax=Pythium insidiosum TaxID=114742 RepID=A0AAD5QA65_PYTIN|nr:hypothetical protein P43SY_009788 [Pythium insidiosum]